MTYGGFHKNKRRSKQKNLKKDTRPENLRPGGADYVAPEDRPGYVAPKQDAKKDKQASTGNDRNSQAAANSKYEDMPLNCRDCSEQFVFTRKEQATYAEKGFETFPSRCKKCRGAKRGAVASASSEGGDAAEALKQPKKKKNAPQAKTPSPPQPLKVVVAASSASKEEGDDDDDSESSSSSGDDDEPVDELPIKRGSNSEGTKDGDSESSSDSDDSDDEADAKGHTEKKSDEDEDEDDEDEDDRDEDDGEDEAAEVDEEEEEWVEGEDEEVWQDRDDALLATPLESFDMYEALEIPKSAVLSDDSGRVRGGNARLRAQV